MCICLCIHTHSWECRDRRQPEQTQPWLRKRMQPRGPLGHHSNSSHKALQQDHRTLKKHRVKCTALITKYAKPQKPYIYTRRFCCCLNSSHTHTHTNGVFCYCLNSKIMQVLELNTNFFQDYLLISINCLRDFTQNKKIKKKKCTFFYPQL